MSFYKAVCFDLFDTLVFFDKDRYFAVRDHGLTLCGINPPEFNEVWDSTRSEAFNGTFKIMSDRYRKVLELMNLPIEECLETLLPWEIKAASQAVTPVDDITQLLKDLKLNKIRIGLISNASCIAPLILNILQWNVFFDDAIFSYLENLRKPDPQIFTLASQRLFCSVEHAVFVSDGDRFELTGAADAGMDTVRFDPSGVHSHLPLPPGCYDCKDVESLRNRLLTE